MPSVFDKLETEDVQAAELSDEEITSIVNQLLEESGIASRLPDLGIA